MISPIQTRRHFIKKVEFETIKDLHEDGRDELKFNHTSRKHEDHWHVILGVKFGPVEDKSSAHFKGEIVMEGLFDIAEGFPEERIEDLVKMNGGAILYGAIRELVMNLSARSNYGPFELPTIDTRVFIDPENKEKLIAQTKGE